MSKPTNKASQMEQVPLEKSQKVVNFPHMIFINRIKMSLLSFKMIKNHVTNLIFYKNMLFLKACQNQTNKASQMGQIPLERS